MTELEALVGLNLTLDIGSIRLQKLCAVFGRPQDIFKADPGHLMQIDGIKAGICAKIKGITEEAIAREMESARRNGIEIVSVNSSSYPQSLRYTADHPVLLYVKGSLSTQDAAAIALVGSRSPSLYGMAQAQRFAAELVQRRVTVVSGLARGIDTAAHRGALRASGRTLAVIGSGLLNMYPGENRELAEQIARQGAVISEFPLTAAPLRQNFPRRNRVISGLSLGVVVVEAARNSGALITADCALEQGREVFALPGRLDMPNASGANALIQQGAKLVMSVEDILAELPIAAARPQQHQLCVETLSCKETPLYTIIGEQPIGFDELAEKTRLDAPRLCWLLFNLQAAHRIKKLAGGYYVRNEHVREKTGYC